MFAAAKKLDNLIGFTDSNKLQIDGPVGEIVGLEPLADKWSAFGWAVIRVQDGNDAAQVGAAITRAKQNRGTGKPTMVILNTIKGKGVSFIEDKGAANHNMNISEEDARLAIAEIREA
jgi:transketolase